MTSEVVIRQPQVSELEAVRNFRRSELDIARDATQTGPLVPTTTDLAPATIHMAAFIGEELISSVRLEPVPDTIATYSVNQMVTRGSYRGQGIGARVLIAAEAVAVERGAKTFILESRPLAQTFYLRLGYQSSGARPHYSPHHIPMVKQVAP